MTNVTCIFFSFYDTIFLLIYFVEIVYVCIENFVQIHNICTKNGNLCVNTDNTNKTESIGDIVFETVFKTSLALVQIQNDYLNTIYVFNINIFQKYCRF